MGGSDGETALSRYGAKAWDDISGEKSNTSGANPDQAMTERKRRERERKILVGEQEATPAAAKRKS